VEKIFIIKMKKLRENDAEKCSMGGGSSHSVTLGKGKKGEGARAMAPLKGGETVAPRRKKKVR